MTQRLCQPCTPSYSLKSVVHSHILAFSSSTLFIFFFNATAPPEIYTLSLHDALPISRCSPSSWRRAYWPRASCSPPRDRKSTRLNSSHVAISYAVFCLKKKKKQHSSLTTHRQPPT